MTRGAASWRDHVRRWTDSAGFVLVWMDGAGLGECLLIPIYQSGPHVLHQVASRQMRIRLPGRIDTCYTVQTQEKLTTHLHFFRQLWLSILDERLPCFRHCKQTWNTLQMFGFVWQDNDMRQRRALYAPGAQCLFSCDHSPSCLKRKKCLSCALKQQQKRVTSVSVSISSGKQNFYSSQRLFFFVITCRN